MGWLRDIFGPSKEEIWQQLAAQVGGQFVEGGWFGTDYVQARVGDWILTLDTYTVSSGKSSTTYTRFRTPFVNRDGFYFRINRAGFFTPLGKLFGMQDLEVGDPFFDEQFVLQSNDPLKLGGLLANTRIRSLLHVQPQISFQVQDDQGWFGPQYPEGVDELYFQVHGVMTNLEHLHALYELFAEVLNQLCHLDSAYKDDVTLHIEALHGPSGRIESNSVLLWDGETARHRAVQALATFRGDPRVVTALLQALPTAGFGLRHDLIRALGAVGDPGAAPHLILYLGGVAQAPNYWGSTRAAAADALRSLGQADTVEAFTAVLHGETEALSRLNPAWRSLFIAAFRSALEAVSGLEVAAAARALVEWSVVEAAPELRKAARRFGDDRPTRDVLDQAIQELERRSALPRPSQTPAPAAQGLPLPAAEATPSPHDLPRPSHTAPER